MTVALDELIRLAGAHARNILIDKKEAGLMPVFLFQTGGGETGIIAGGVDMSSAEEKDELAGHARNVMRDHGAVAYSFLSEAWMAVLKAGSPQPRNVRDRPDRVEVVYAVAFDAAGDGRSMCWRMTRAPEGYVTALEPMPVPTGPDVLAGRFANLLQSRA